MNHAAPWACAGQRCRLSQTAVREPFTTQMTDCGLVHQGTRQ